MLEGLLATMCWLLREASEQMWSYATLNRNIATQYYDRMLLSQQKELVEAEILNQHHQWFKSDSKKVTLFLGWGCVAGDEGDDFFAELFEFGRADA